MNCTTPVYQDIGLLSYPNTVENIFLNIVYYSKLLFIGSVGQRGYGK